MQQDKKKEYRRYGSTSFDLARNPHDRKPFEPSLIFLLEGLDFKGRVEHLEKLIKYAAANCLRNRNDEYVSRLVTVFDRALVDKGYEDILRPIAKEPGKYEFEDAEFTRGYHPISGRHPSVPSVLMNLYASLPVVFEYVGEPEVVAMPLTKGKILEHLVQYSMMDFRDFEELLVFLLNCSVNKQILKDETEMWRGHLKNATTRVSEGLLMRHAERVAKWPIHTVFREELLRFLLVARLRSLGFDGLSALVLSGAPKV